MSYVDLKHRLADLTLDVVADPQAAADWVAVLFAVAQSEEVRGTGLSNAGLERLVRNGILARTDDRIMLRPEFQPYRAYFTRHAGRLLSFFTRYRAVVSPPSTVPRTLWAGILLFNEGLYFECHELLESAWKQTTGPERNFLHGIVQAAAAFYHYEKHNMHGARTLLSKALRRLESYPSPYLEVDLDDLRGSLTRWQTRFAKGSEPEANPPIIRFTTSWAEQSKRTPRG